MKGLSAITTAVLLVAATTSFAATTKSKVKAVSTASTATSTGAAGSATKSPSATATTTQAGTIAAPAPAAPAKNWSLSLYAENYYGIQDASNHEGKMNADGFIAYGYKLSDTRKLAIRQWLFSDIAVAQSSGQTDTRLEDTELVLGMDKVLNWDRGGLSINNRLTLPTGRTSSSMGKIAGLRWDVTANKELNNTLELGYVLSPRLGVQSRNTYMKAGVETETTLFKLVQGGYATAKANDDLSATAFLGTINAITKLSGQNSVQNYLDLSASAQVTKQIGLSIGLDSEPDQKSRQAFLKADSTAYYMNMSATM